MNLNFTHGLAEVKMILTMCLITSQRNVSKIFDIYYDNTISGSGVSYVYSLGGKSNIRTGISYSQLSTSYKKNGYFSPLSDSISIDDCYRLLSSHVGIQTRHSSALTTEIGVQYVNAILITCAPSDHLLKSL